MPSGRKSLERAALLVGFPEPEAEAGAALLRAEGWDRVLTDGGTSVLQLVRREPIDLVVIDVDHSDAYAPHLIIDMRQDMALCAEVETRDQTEIVAMAMVLPEGLSLQLQDAGAHRVLSKRVGRHPGDWVETLAQTPDAPSLHL